ncbi:ArsR/SmtB family transcription factor [Seohaeicola zhoushanensis]|uniref:Transcriptional regulator n=1 Tax=Seohaeicola zhoushanensis TaxID=1569283 RepID=A0A8J3GZG1_9RHOB|nr:metalloregulator ArsR/SmtB family transcription factor [Seohaeicola zhoushanensis]GHF62968.1 transcriptional regulator [Seohaeicola zhoushanensis]
MENNIPPLDSLFHALADPTRRAVVQRLGAGPAAVSELAEPFGMGLPSFMKHLGVLEDAGLIQSAKTGRVRTCTLNPDRLAAAERWFEEQRQLWDVRYRQLDALLGAMQGKPE